MGKQEKLKARLLCRDPAFTWRELVRLLKLFGFEQVERAGSRVDFVKKNLVIKLHRPHPQKEVKAYALRQVKEMLQSEGLL